MRPLASAGSGLLTLPVLPMPSVLHPTAQRTVRGGCTTARPSGRLPWRGAGRRQQCRRCTSCSPVTLAVRHAACHAPPQLKAYLHCPTAWCRRSVRARVPAAV